MTSVLNVDTIADKAGTGPVGLTKQAAAKMYISYNGNTNTIRGSLNVSSTSDDAVGEYTFNYTNNFDADETYSSAMSVELTSSSRPGSYVQGNTALAGSITIRPTRGTGGEMSDTDYVTMNCMGDLA